MISLRGRSVAVIHLLIGNKMFPILVPSNFRIIAHRGASAYAPENTVPAFALAKEMGITEVELDTQLSTDGVVVLCHDHTLERYGHGVKAIEDQSSEFLLKLDMGKWFSPLFFEKTAMATLDQLFMAFNSDFIYHIELKGKAAGLAKSVYNSAESAGLLDRSIFTSFCLDQIIRMREISSDCRLAWLVDSFDDEILSKARELELFQLCPRADLVTESLVTSGHSVVEEIRAWGINGTPQKVRQLIRKVIDCGCNGMTINWPDWVSTRKRSV